MRDCKSMQKKRAKINVHIKPFLKDNLKQDYKNNKNSTLTLSTHRACEVCLHGARARILVANCVRVVRPCVTECVQQRGKGLDIRVLGIVHEAQVQQLVLGEGEVMCEVRWC